MTRDVLCPSARFIIFTPPARNRYKYLYFRCHRRLRYYVTSATRTLEKFFFFETNETEEEIEHGRNLRIFEKSRKTCAWHASVAVRVFPNIP